MGEEDPELLITMDEPGEDTLKEDTFEHPQAEKYPGGLARSDIYKPTREQKSSRLLKTSPRHASRH